MLVLDEPTNDLDLETLELLQDMIANYAGTVLLISHDRSFIDSVVSSVITTAPPNQDGADKPGKWLRYAGGYDDMIAQRGTVPGIAPTKKKQTPPQTNSAKPSKNTASASKKLSYKDKFALENLPKDIAKKEEEIRMLNEVLATAGLFEKDPASFNKSAAALTQAQRDLGALEEQWLELEMKREDLEE